MSQECHVLDHEPPPTLSSLPHTAVQGSVHEVKDYGTLCDLDVHPDIVGVAAPHQV